MRRGVGASQARLPRGVEPMLASLAHGPVDLPGWIYEEKYDGFRFLAFKRGSDVRLVSRNGRDRATDFATISAAIAALPAETLVLDGEVVIFDDAGVSRFQLLQRRELGEPSNPPMYVAFDCVFARGRDLRHEPLRARRAVLERELGAHRSRRVLCVSNVLAMDGPRAYDHARSHGWEGVIAKDPSSRYESGARSDAWLKVKVRREDEFVIGGFTAPKGSRKHLGALLLGAYDDAGRLRYVGKSGTGYTAKTLAELHRLLAPLARATSPFADPVREGATTWVRPARVAEFSYAEITREGRVRQAVFLGLRDDKPARDVRLPGRY